jgi:uncharacterized protein
LLFAIVTRWSQALVRASPRLGWERRAALPDDDDRSTEIAKLLTSSALAALAPWAMDLQAWPRFRHAKPLLVSAALHLAAGTATGLALVALLVTVRALGRASDRRRHLLAGAAAALITALAARQALTPLLALSHWGRPRTLAAIGAAAFVIVLIVAWGLSSVAHSQASPRRARHAWPSLVVLAVTSAALFALDRTVLSSVFEKPYSFIEGLAHLALALALATWLRGRAGSRWARVTTRSLAVASVAWLVVFAASRPLRRAIERALPAVWEDPTHAARWLRRVRRVESPGAPLQLQRIAEKYDVGEVRAIDERWLAQAARPAAPVPTPAPAPATSAVSATAPDQRPWNVAVFFVDALRADVAHDPAVMPETVAWMHENQWFSRAYSTGSSTLLMLAPLLGCRYDAMTTDRPMLIDAAHASGMRTRLVIPKSASDYHHGYFPELRFPEQEIVPDVAKGHVPSAGAVVDRSLAWLRTERPERFFLWLYHFDVHSSSDLDDGYVEDHAREGNFSKVDGLHWRYRSAARGIDRAFARFRAGLDELGLADRTVVLFVSDHGESLGKQNFWGHTTYLWESLIRVPLALHVPGLSAHAHDEPVSTVDLGTTLARYIGPLTDTTSCHGEDLLARQGDAPRRFPIMFSAAVDGQLARIGMLASNERKVIVDLRDADARLVRFEDGNSDEHDQSSLEPDELSSGLGHLLRSPLYPRGAR